MENTDKHRQNFIYQNLRVQTQGEQVACLLATGADSRQELITLPRSVDRADQRTEQN